MSSAPQIVLASASPRRKELLTRIGLAIAVIPADIDETVLPDELPEAHVERLSLAKARAIAARRDVDGRWFIGSDTVVVRDDVILGKPADAADATVMLRSLAGRSHRVVSGYAVVDREQNRFEAAAIVTRVNFRELTDAEIAGYIATGEPADKAGAYGIQGIGASLVRSIDGSYTNVVGLPLCEVVETLERMGAATLFGPHL
ncbi:MAG: septum formation inhibitor Maf [Desulfuromonadales bacterium]|nr:septum formation inhibitor Maf [Desulfuromonadales bacterium]